MNMLKNYKLLLVGIGVIIVILVILNAYPKTKNDENLKNILTQKTEIELQEEAAEIIKSGNFEKCDEINDSLYKKVCINNIALNLAEELSDASYCQKLDNDLVKIDECERRIIIRKSQEKEDIVVCDEAKNMEIQKDCRKIFWPGLVLKKDNLALCENISEKDEEILCYDNYLFEKEFTQNPPQFDCQKFSNSQIRIDCQAHKENQENCSNFKSNVFFNYCFINDLKR